MMFVMLSEVGGGVRLSPSSLPPYPTSLRSFRNIRHIALSKGVYGPLEAFRAFKMDFCKDDIRIIIKDVLKLVDKLPEDKK